MNSFHIIRMFRNVAQRLNSMISKCREALLLHDLNMYSYRNKHMLKTFFSRNGRKTRAGRVKLSSERTLFSDVKAHARLSRSQVFCWTYFGMCWKAHVTLVEHRWERRTLSITATECVSQGRQNWINKHFYKSHTWLLTQDVSTENALQLFLGEKQTERE